MPANMLVFLHLPMKSQRKKKSSDIILLLLLLLSDIFNGGELLFFCHRRAPLAHHFLIYFVRLKRCSFRQMRSRAALRSALWWSHESLLRQRQGHTKYSVFTAQLSAYHFLFTCLLRARSLFFILTYKYTDY